MKEEFSLKKSHTDLANLYFSSSNNLITPRLPNCLLQKLSTLSSSDVFYKILLLMLYFQLICRDLNLTCRAVRKKTVPFDTVFNLILYPTYFQDYLWIRYSGRPSNRKA